MGSPPAPQGDNKRFDVLILDYSLVREDERTLFNIQASVTGIAVALLAGIATLVSDTCQLNQHKGCTKPPDIFLAGAPAIPLGVLALLQTIAASSAMRIYYMRALEKEIREYAQAPLTQLIPVANIAPASYAGLLVEVTTLRRGRSGFRFLAVLIMLIAFFTFGGLTLYIAFSLTGAYRVGMIIGYGISFAVLFVNVASVTLGARQTFIRVAKRFSARQNSSMFEGAHIGSVAGRSLGSYLLFPRPEDWSKWMFIPLVFILASWGQGGGHHWIAMLTALLVTEYLVYSARYQWNDIRGLRDDRDHPQTAARFRLPRIESSRHARFVVGSSLSVTLLRLLAALALGTVFDRVLAVLLLIFAVFTVAIAYELLRQLEIHSDAAARGLWVIIGVGYAVRFLVGLYVAGEPLNSSLALVGAAYAYSFGVMFVLLTWILEGTSFCAWWPPDEWYIADDAIRRKRHITLLLEYLHTPRVNFTPPLSPPPDPVTCGNTHVLAVPGSVRTMFAPWRVAFIITALCSGPLGMLLTHDRITHGPAAASVLVAGMSAVFIVRSSGVVALYIIASCTLALVGISYLAGFSRSLADLSLVASPWFLNGAMYLSFTQQSYIQLKNFAPDLAEQVTKALLQVLRWIVGPDTSEEMDLPEQRS